MVRCSHSPASGSNARSSARSPKASSSRKSASSPVSAGVESTNICVGSVRANAVHALDLPAPGGRLRGRRAARHRRELGPRRARVDGELSRQIGLRRGLAWGFEVKLPPGYSGPSGRKAKQSMSFWASRGLARIDGRPLGPGDAALLMPAGRDGPAFLVTRNFDVASPQRRRILHPRRLRARRSLGRRPHRGIVTPWPTDDPLLPREGRKEFGAARKTRLRRRRPTGRRHRNQEQSGDR